MSNTITYRDKSRSPEARKQTLQRRVQRWAKYQGANR